MVQVNEPLLHRWRQYLILKGKTLNWNYCTKGLSPSSAITWLFDFNKPLSFVFKVSSCINRGNNFCVPFLTYRFINLYMQRHIGRHMQRHIGGNSKGQDVQLHRCVLCRSGRPVYLGCQEWHPCSFALDTYKYTYNYISTCTYTFRIY